MNLIDGYLYHIKDELFDILSDKYLMQNKDNKRPTYFVIKEKKTNLFWFIPLSTKIEKYKKIINKKLEKHKTCNTILIEKIGKKTSAILIQNAFPTIPKYIDHIHEINGKPLKVVGSLKKKIASNFFLAMKLYNKGYKNIFFSDIENNVNIMLKELEEIKVSN